MIFENSTYFGNYIPECAVIHGFPLPAQKDNEKRKIVKTP